MVALPVLLISGYSAEDQLHELDERTRFLRKPFTPGQLREAVRQSLRRRNVKSSRADISTQGRNADLPGLI